MVSMGYFQTCSKISKTMVWTIKNLILLPNIIVILGTIDKFDHNLVLVNINKLKPWRFIENKTLQPILIKPNDLIIDEFVQTKEPKPLPIELEDFQHVEFESINNYLTHGSIIKIDVHAHYYHDVHVEDNNVIVYNDQMTHFVRHLLTSIS